MLKCAQELVAATRAEIREVSWAEVEGNDGPAGLLVDVREPHEFAENTVPGAINIPRGLLEFSIDNHPALRDLDEQALLDCPLVLICGTGGRSVLAARTLQGLGFTNVCSVQGGLKLRE